MNYVFNKELEGEFKDIVEIVRGKLNKEGFGVLTEIDVKKTLKEKLDVDYDEYLILGACNPPFAYEALKTEKEIGLLMPCNVIVYLKNERVNVSAINPVVAMGMVENGKLKEIAEEVGKKLKKVIEEL